MSTDPGLGAEIALVKRSILYADHIVLNSPTAVMLAGVEQIGTLQGAQRWEFLFSLPEGIIGELSQIDGDVASALMQIQQLRDGEGMNRAARRASKRQRGEFREQLKTAGLEGPFQELDRGWEEMSVRLGDLTEPARRELMPAIDAGVLSIHPLLSDGDDSDGDLDELLAAYVARIYEVMRDGSSYPVLDDMASGLVRASISEGASMGRNDRLSHAAIGTGLLGRVPELPQAGMEDLIQLRTDLGDKGVGYRKAIEDFRKSITTVPLDDGFEEALNHLWVTTVEPEVVDLIRLLNETTWLREAGWALIDDPMAAVKISAGLAAGSATFAVSNAQALGTILTATIAVAGGSAPPVLGSLGQGIQRSRKGRKQAESNNLFLLAAATKRLGG